MVCRTILFKVVMLRSDCAKHPRNHMLERDVDVVLKGDLVTAEPPGVDADLGNVGVCGYTGWMGAIVVLG